MLNKLFAVLLCTVFIAVNLLGCSKPAITEDQATEIALERASQSIQNWNPANYVAISDGEQTIEKNKCYVIGIYENKPDHVTAVEKYAVVIKSGDVLTYDVVSDGYAFG